LHSIAKTLQGDGWGIHTYIHTFNGLFSKTTWVSRHQKGKPFWISLKQETMGWQWHQLDHMQIICTTLQTEPCQYPISQFFYGPNALPDAQPTVSKGGAYIRYLFSLSDA